MSLNRQQKFPWHVSRNSLLILVKRVEEMRLELLKTSLNELQTQ